MNMSITSVISWQEIKHWQDTKQDMFVISKFFERLYGNTAANIATILILWITLSSLFAVLLGYSRVPYAAAVDGTFFRVFGKLHPVKNFPYVSLLVLASIAFVFSLLIKMKDAIDGILAMRIIVQFIGQAIGVVLLRKRRGTIGLPYKMPLYPLPVILAIAIWLFVFLATGLKVIVSFIIVFCSGLIVYFVYAKLQKQWPFEDTRVIE
jgi:fructoselysine transporter